MTSRWPTIVEHLAALEILLKDQCVEYDKAVVKAGEAGALKDRLLDQSRTSHMKIRYMHHFAQSAQSDHDKLTKMETHDLS